MLRVRLGEIVQRGEQAQICSAELARAVNESEAWPTRDEIDARELAARLRPYDIEPRLHRHGNEVLRGYRSADFHDAFRRYLSGMPVV